MDCALIHIKNSRSSPLHPSCRLFSQLQECAREGAAPSHWAGACSCIATRNRLLEKRARRISNSGQESGRHVFYVGKGTWVQIHGLRTLRSLASNTQLRLSLRAAPCSSRAHNGGFLAQTRCVLFSGISLAGVFTSLLLVQPSPDMNAWLVSASGGRLRDCPGLRQQPLCPRCPAPRHFAPTWTVCSLSPCLCSSVPSLGSPGAHSRYSTGSIFTTRGEGPVCGGSPLAGTLGESSFQEK